MLLLKAFSVTFVNLLAHQPIAPPAGQRPGGGSDIGVSRMGSLQWISPTLMPLSEADVRQIVHTLERSSQPLLDWEIGLLPTTDQAVARLTGGNLQA